MKALALVGFAKSGKTTLALALAKALKARGLTVAAAKSSHHPLDRPDSDTARLAEVCDAVAGLGDGGTTLFWNARRHLPDLLPLLAADVLLVEGGKGLGWLPRVLLPRPGDDLEPLGPDLALAAWGHDAPGLWRPTDVEALADLALSRGFALPGLDCGACGRADCRGLAADIVAGRAAPEDCRARGGDLTVTVGASPLAMNPFVAGILRGAILGMLGGLKGYAPGLPVRIDLAGGPHGA